MHFWWPAVGFHPYTLEMLFHHEPYRFMNLMNLHDEVTRIQNLLVSSIGKFGLVELTLQLMISWKYRAEISENICHENKCSRHRLISYNHHESRTKSIWSISALCRAVGAGMSSTFKESAPGVDTVYTSFSETMLTGSETELFGLELVWCVSGNS